MGIVCWGNPIISVDLTSGKITKEVIDEKRVPVCTEALKLISRLRSALIQDTLEDSLNFVRQQDAWFWQNIAFLPHKFSDKWLSIKLGLRRAILFEKVQAAMVNGPDRDRRIEELVDLQSFMGHLAKEAEREIRNELCLPEVKIEHPHKIKKS